MDNENQTMTFGEKKIFPIKELSAENLTAALNNLHERMTAFENRSHDDRETVTGSAAREEILTPTDIACLDGMKRFLGLHGVVAETLASKAAGVTDIDPTTGQQRVIKDAPKFASVELSQTGS